MTGRPRFPWSSICLRIEGKGKLVAETKQRYGRPVNLWPMAKILMAKARKLMAKATVSPAADAVFILVIHM